MEESELDTLTLRVSSNEVKINTLKKDLSGCKNELSTNAANNTFDIGRLDLAVNRLITLVPELSYNYPNNMAITYMKEVMKLNDKDIDTLMKVMPIALGIDKQDFCIPFAKAHIYNKIRWSE